MLILKRKVLEMKKSKQGKSIKLERPMQLRFFEKKYMIFIGKRDGKLGVVRLDKDGNWVSPKLIQEWHALNEFEAKVLIEMEARLTENHIQLDMILSEIDRFEKLLEEVISGINEIEQISVIKFDDTEDMSVKKMRTEIKLKLLYSKLALCRAEINQEECMTRMICEAAQSRTHKRVDFYWQGVLTTHSTTEQLPPQPTAIIEYPSEILYLSQHNTSDYSRTRLIDLKSRLKEVNY